MNDKFVVFSFVIFFLDLAFLYKRNFFLKSKMGFIYFSFHYILLFLMEAFSIAAMGGVDNDFLIIALIFLFFYGLVRMFFPRFLLGAESL